MDVGELAGLIRRRWLPVVLLAVLGAAGAYGFTLSVPKEYTARATVLVGPAAGASTTEINQGAVYVERLVQTYAELVRTPVVLDPVAEQLDMTRAELLDGVSATITSGTSLIDVVSTSGSPQQAADVANAVSAELATAVEELAPTAEGRTSVVVSTVSVAAPPGSPSGPDVTANTLLGLLIGIVVGLGYVVLSSTFDTRVTTAAETRRLTSAPVVGLVSRPKRSRSAIAERDPWAEDYRRLRTNLRLLDAAQRPGTLVVTSCTPHEGKTAVAFGLARTAVEGGLRVALLEADLRTPRLAEALRLGDGPGLSEIVLGQSTLADVVHVVDGVHVVHAGKATTNPGDMVTSAPMAELLADMSSRYDLVIADAPPLLSVTDGAALGASAHGVVLVVARSHVTRAEVTGAVSAVEMAGAHLLGSIINDVPDEKPKALVV